MKGIQSSPTMLIKIYPENPNSKHIRQIVDVLDKGGIIIYPTDTVYSIGCDINNHKAFERLALLKGKKPAKAQFSIICKDLSHLSTYAKPLNNSIYKMMKRALPGPFTFILNSSNAVPRIFKAKKKTIGIRVPDNDIAREIIKELGRPLIVSSVKDDEIEYTTNPELIQEKYGHLVDYVIDGGIGNIEASTVVDCTGDTPEIIREGAGDLDLIY